MKKSLALALLACAPFASAQAAELQYGYVEASYSHATMNVEVVNADVTDAGFGLKAGMAFGDRFYGEIGTHKETFDGAKLSPSDLTVGFRHAMAQNVDFIAEASYLGVNARIDGENYHNDGVRAAAGVRAAVGEHVELGAKLTWTDVENMDDVVGVNVHGQVKFDDHWGVVGQYHYNEYAYTYYGLVGTKMDNWQLGVRYSF